MHFLFWFVPRWQWQLGLIVLTCLHASSSAHVDSRNLEEHLAGTSCFPPFCLLASRAAWLAFWEFRFVHLEPICWCFTCRGQLGSTMVRFPAWKPAYSQIVASFFSSSYVASLSFDSWSLIALVDWLLANWSLHWSLDWLHLVASILAFAQALLVPSSLPLKPSSIGLDSEINSNWSWYQLAALAACQYRWSTWVSRSVWCRWASPWRLTLSCSVVPEFQSTFWSHLLVRGRHCSSRKLRS